MSTIELNLGSRVRRSSEIARPTWEKKAKGLLGTYSLALADTQERIEAGQNPELTHSYAQAIAASVLNAPGQDLLKENCWHTTASALKIPLERTRLHLGEGEKDGNVPWQAELALVNDTGSLIAQKGLLNVARTLRTDEFSDSRFAYNEAQKLMQRGEASNAVDHLAQAITPLLTTKPELPNRTDLQIDWESEIYPERTQFTEKGRKAVEFLQKISGLPLKNRVMILASDPYLGRTLAKMDPEMAEHFTDWISAQQIVNAAWQAADTHALQETGLRGSIQRKISGIQGFVNSTNPENSPRPPKPPSRGQRVLGLAAFGILTMTILAACAPQDDDTDQSDATPVPPAVPTLIASELPTVAATFAASPTPDGSNNEAMTTPLYRPTVDAFRGQIPPDLLGSLDSYGVQDVVDQYALGNPTLATELTAESANLIHALLGDPESLVVLPDNIEPIGISHNNQYPDTFINGNHLGFKVVAGNEAPTDEYPEGTLFFWNDGQDVASATDPEIARSNVLIIKPPQGGTLERMEYANLYTIVGINAEGEIVFYLNESNERLDKDGKPIDAAATIEAEGAQITSTPVPADTPTPELTPTPEPSPTPELILEEGEVRYEFRTPDSSEIISFAIPEEWVNILSYTENESGQFYNDRPLAQAGIVEESGIRKFKVGNITVAEEIDGKWEKNETVYVMENYLDFEGRILAQDENLGRIDPNQISAPKVGVKFSVNSKNVPGIGAINYKVIHNPIIVGATRTNIVVIDQNNRPLETAQMQLDMAYWTQNGDNYSLSQFSVTGHDIIGVDDGPVLLANFNPDLGETLTSLFLIWSNNLAPETDRQSAVAANSMWRMSGLGMLTETTEPSVSNGSTLELPSVFLASIEP